VSLRDCEPESAQAVLDNTRTPDVLALDDPKLCCVDCSSLTPSLERSARRRAKGRSSLRSGASTLGTYPRLENTLQRGNHPLVDTTTDPSMSPRAVCSRIEGVREEQSAGRRPG
jgi:hypothetical protein